jgi:hypothetical protein
MGGTKILEVVREIIYFAIKKVESSILRKQQGRSGADDVKTFCPIEKNFLSSSRGLLCMCLPSP